MLIEIVIIICICSINISFSFLSKVDVFRGRGFSSLHGEMNHNEQRRTIQTDSILDKLFRPSHIGIPRKRMDLQFAVLLMR